MYFNLWHLLFSKRWWRLFLCQLFGWSSSSFIQDMTRQISTSQRSQWTNDFHDMPAIYTDLSLPFPEMSVITDQLTCHAKDQDHSVLFPEMSVIECLSWHASDLHRSFRYLPWDVSDHRSIRSPTCHTHDQDNSVLFPWDVSDLNQSDAFLNMPVIYRSFRFLPWDVIDQRTIRALTWHASDQDHSVPFSEISVI